MASEQEQLENLSESMAGLSDGIVEAQKDLAGTKSVELDLERIQQKLREAHDAIEESRKRVAQALEAAHGDQDRHRPQ